MKRRHTHSLILFVVGNLLLIMGPALEFNCYCPDTSLEKTGFPIACSYQLQLASWVEMEAVSTFPSWCWMPSDLELCRS